MTDFIRNAREFISGTPTREDWIAFGIVLGLGVLALAGFIFGFQPRQARSVEAFIAEDTAVQLVLEEAIRKKDRFTEFEAETSEVKGLVSEFEERLPSRSEIGSLMQEFEQMAAMESVKIEMSSLTRIPDQYKETIPYSIVARGDFHQLVAFINRLELFKRFLKISELNIEPQVRGVAVARFTLNTYRFIERDTVNVAGQS